MARSRSWPAVAGLALCAALAAQGPPFGMPSIPLVNALDADGDASLSAEEIRNAAEALRSLDSDGSSAVTADELAPRFAGRPGGPPPEGRGGRGDPSNFLRRLPLMAALDSDGDGRIAAAEIRGAPDALVALDADGSGALEGSEMMPRFGGRGRPGQGRRPALASIPLIAGLDLDGSGEISAEELAGAPSALRSLDTDSDGVVSAREMLPARAGPGGPAGRGGRGGGTGGPRGGGRPQMPVLQALDLDSSGDLTASEIAAAAASLATLDSDGSGSLSASEIAPRMLRPMGPGGGETAAELKAPDELDLETGAAAIPDRATFERLSYQGRQVMIDSGLIGLEFVKFVVTGASTESPALYFQNTENYRAHPQFMRAVGISAGGRGGGGPGARGAAAAGRRGGGGAGARARSGTMRGALVYRPLLTSPGGGQGLYTFEFQPRDAFPFEMVKAAYGLLEENSPLLAGNLAYYPLSGALPLYERERSRYEAANIAVFSEDQLFKDIAYLPLNIAEGFGHLRLMSLDERPGEREIVLYRSLPNELPRVAGVITGVSQTPLSHVNLRAVQDAVPNAYIRGAAEDPRIMDLVGKYVYYRVAEDGYEIREATVAEVEAHFDKLRPGEPPALARDLSVKEIRALGEIGFSDSASVGVKAANVAALGTLGFPDGAVPKGFAIPFHYYHEYMLHNGFYERAGDMLGIPGFAADTETREQALRAFRREVRGGEMPAWMLAALSDLQGAFPAGRPIRLRSSTNNEDLPGFSGAGLYDSYTHHPDEGHISKSVRQVFASLWNFRAFEEREFFRVDHLQAAMGVLVHPNYSDELANGVAVTEDIVYQTGSHGRPRSYYVNVQVGEELVTNPEGESVPEEILLSPRGAAQDRYIRASNRTDGDAPLLSAAHRDELRGYLRTVHSEFAELYDVAPGDPFAMEIEFKVTAAGRLAVKQARPWVFH